MLKVSLEPQLNRFAWNDICGHEHGHRLSGLTGSAHPIAKHGCMRSLMMVRMMRFVGNGLCRGEASNREQAEDHQQGERLFHQRGIHSVRHNKIYQADGTEPGVRASSRPDQKPLCSR